MLYKDWLMEWLINYVKHSVKDKTLIAYTNIVENHLIPEIGDYDINGLTPLIVQRYISELLKTGNLKTGNGLASNSVNVIISIIQKSLHTAELIGILNKYDMDKVQRPRSKEKAISCFSLFEQKQIEAAAINDQRHKMKGIIICLYTGIRLGELLALEWSDIDLQQCELNINKACHDGKNSNGIFCRITEKPKTESSIRRIPIPRQISPLLCELKEMHLSKYVISNKDGKPIMLRTYQRDFEKMQKRIGISHRGFHSLRHTFATRAVERGMDVKTLSEILGHKNASVTLNRYVHTLTEHKIIMMDKIGALF